MLMVPTLFEPLIFCSYKSYNLSYCLINQTLDDITEIVTKETQY